MSDGKLRYIASSMDTKLPYTLTKGVTATREGLRIDEESATVQAWFFAYINADASGIVYVPWPDAAERLRYREGEPWICVDDEYPNYLTCSNDDWPVTEPLHRLAAILCDDAEAFRLLHWCVTELGGRA